MPPSQQVAPHAAACPFGLGCTRNKPQHFIDETHPQQHPRAVSISLIAGGGGGGGGGISASTGPPAYWTSSQLKGHDGVFFRPIIDSVDPAIWATLQDSLKTDGSWLNIGNDVKEKSSVPYTRLELSLAWRIENKNKWQMFKLNQTNIKADMDRIQKNAPTRLRLVDPIMTASVAPCLPGQLRTDVNETFLFHCTAPENIFSLAANGFNEHYSTSPAFGHGNYFAEDAGKSDQYAVNDPKFGAFKELHDRIFATTAHPNEKIYYVLLCRATLGATLRTATAEGKGHTCMDLDHPTEKIFPHTPKELAPIVGVSPPTNAHSLIVEKGRPPTNLRYREFVLFHGVNAYPEYLLAYKRV
jgi:hypothetical protein